MMKYLILPFFLMCSLSVTGSDEVSLDLLGSDGMTQSTVTRSGLSRSRFTTTVDGKQTSLYTLSNNSMEACITNYGARVVSLMVPDQDGRLGDVVLGFDNIEDYINKKQTFGGVVGRYAGRIRGARFALDGVPYILQPNSGINLSHGGHPGFSDRVWDVLSANDSLLRLRYVSPDGENGFPGTLTVTVTYTLTYDHSLDVAYEAHTDKPTVVNLTNNMFFNISGDPSSTILSHTLYVDSKYIATYDKDKNVDGRFMKVKNTPFDFTTAKAIGSDIDIMDEQMGITKGYDHGFALRHAGNLNRAAAILYDAKSGRRLTVFTTEPSIQVYTANGLNGSMTGKNGIAYNRCSAICLGTMHFSDSPNQSDFPSTTLRPGESYRSHTIYHFSDKQSHKQRNLLSSILMYGGVASLTGLGIFGLVTVLK